MYDDGTQPLTFDVDKLRETVGLYSVFIRALLRERGKPLEMTAADIRTLPDNFIVQDGEEENSVLIRLPQMQGANLH